MNDYDSFLDAKTHNGCNVGFEPVFMPKFLFPFQQALCDWAIRKGRGAIFADCGLGKTPIQLTWAQNVVEKTNGNVLILTPLSVGRQHVREADKFGFEASVSRDGSVSSRVTITNYQQLHKFNSLDFQGVVCDESSILKNPDGVTRKEVTDFMRKMPYRLLCTATAAPNDHIELGTSSEAVGELGFADMLNRFFKKSEETTSRSEEYRSGLYRFRGHAEKTFWRWVCSWARAVRKPSDMGFDDGHYQLPELRTTQHIVKASNKNPEYLIEMPAVGLREQREERSRTVKDRCQKAAELIAATDEPSVAWVHLNSEGKLLEKLIPGSVEVSGSHSDDFKEETFDAFSQGQIKTVISKPVIAGYGLNWQHCAHQTFFPSHSFEQYYQAVRRSWRFGQERPVRVDVITTESESRVLANMTAKAKQADEMFAKLVALINNELKITRTNTHTKEQAIPSWL